MDPEQFSEQMGAFRWSIAQLHHKYRENCPNCQEQNDQLFDEMGGVIEKLQAADARPISIKNLEVPPPNERPEMEILASFTDGLVCIDRVWRI